MNQNYFLLLAESIKREGIVLVANIDQKKACKYVKNLLEYNCEVDVELYIDGTVFSLEQDENGRELGSIVNGYLFKMK